MEEDIGVLIGELKGMKDNKVFNPFIDYIRFPFYRNLEKDTKITFDFPLTVFVGQNGSGKSSTLQALYGCPLNYSIGKFWFSTKVDPIETSGERPAIIYAYHENGKQVEVLKQRSKRNEKPDYWEPSKPVLKYGMEFVERDDEKDRNPPIQMDVLYIDFRSILSAFDKYFYYFTPDNLKSKTPQDFLRTKSTFLRNVIDTDKIIKCGSKKQNTNPEKISEDELKIMSSILNKKYIDGKIISHKFFREWGNSILFTTFDVVYSEAFAGSGEIAVATLVHELLKVKNNSLVLLDEPEISLHPGAQKKLKRFILEQIKNKHLQVVISTHSTSIIEELPPYSIKVFTQLPEGKFHVENQRMPEEAFFYIGQNPNRKNKIIVEDNLSQKIIQSVIKKMGPEKVPLFDIEFHPGGESVIKKNFITVYSQESKRNRFIIFDGDQKPEKEHFNPAKIPIGDILPEKFDETISKLNEIIKEQTYSEISFHTDGDSRGGNKKQKIELMIKYLEFYHKNVFYLPLSIPEEIIWDEDTVKHFLILKSDSEEIMEQICSTVDYKEKFKIFSRAISGCDDGKSILFAQKMLLENWLEKEDDNYKEILAIINKILI